MKNILAAAARAVLVLAALASMLWAATGAPGLWEAARLAVMCAVIGAAQGVSALLPGGGGDRG